MCQLCCMLGPVSSQAKQLRLTCSGQRTGASQYHFGHVPMQVILKQLDLIEDQTTVKTLHKKMAPPLVTLLSAESEIQYVALRNINLIVQKNPGILAHEVKV